MEGLQDKRIELPTLRRDRRLPVVLSKPEVKRLLSAPLLLKHRVLLATLYGCGLRNFELWDLKLQDLDFDRRMLHVRQGEGGKDRYVPLSHPSNLSARKNGSSTARCRIASRGCWTGATPPPACSGWCERHAMKPASPSRSRPTRCATPLPPTSWRTGWTLSRSRTCWATPASTPPWSTCTWPKAGAASPSPRWTRSTASAHQP
ncbi:hypothetical protein POKO110462_20895 [Pontibacter korlensis]